MTGFDRYLFQQGATWDDKVALRAAFARSIPVFEILLEQGFQVDQPMSNHGRILPWVLLHLTLVETPLNS